MSEIGTENVVLLNIPVYVGKYCIGGGNGFCIALERKPNFVHRYFMKLLLGWEWINET